MNRKHNWKAFGAALALMLTTLLGTSCNSGNSNSGKNTTDNLKTTDTTIQEPTEMTQEELEGLAKALPKYNVVSNFHEGLAVVCNRETDLYGFIEEVALAIHGPLYIGADSFQPKYSYCRLSYPSDINSANDAIPLIHSELTRCETLGEGLVAEVGRNRLRKAYRPDYIEALLQEKLKSRRVDGL